MIAVPERTSRTAAAADLSAAIRPVKPNAGRSDTRPISPAVLDARMTRSALSRRDLRTTSGRRAEQGRRAIGEELHRLREDAHLSLRAVAAAARLTPGHLSEIERGVVEASLATLWAVADVLGADVSVRLFPSAGARIRDHIQAPTGEALLGEIHRDWKRLVEVPVWRPVRGVIDAVFANPGELVIATEIQSAIRRLEQQIRWGEAKAEALPSSTAWSMLSAGRPSVPISRLLVLRTTAANREVVRAFEETLRAAFPGSSSAALAALRNPSNRWPGPTILWARVERGRVTILDGPPRRVRVGR